jgi:16S rRNA (guanine527-N7)-methyltransferase
VTASEPSTTPSGPVPDPPADAVELFGLRLGLATAYAAELAGVGVAHGHLGPREVERIWSRHLVNSALLTDLLPDGARFADVGSGAGLPGLPMAIRRPDLHAVLVEPMQRRAEFLGSVVATLDLESHVTVVRGRADDAVVLDSVAGIDWVVARAVAPLDRLMRWCLPLVSPGGRVLALKGESAADEVAQHRQAVSRAGGEDVQVLELSTPAGVDGGAVEKTWVVSVRRAAVRAGRAKGRRR